jgi:hypothetical protein
MHCTWYMICPWLGRGWWSSQSRVAPGFSYCLYTFGGMKEKNTNQRNPLIFDLVVLMYEGCC